MDGVSEELAKALEIGEAVDRALAGWREVGGLLFPVAEARLSVGWAEEAAAEASPWSSLRLLP